jgi:transcriptional regulator with XRE-family HTH domain
VKIYKYKDRCNISGEQIRRRRLEMDISQEQLAARLQVNGLTLNQKAISRIETGERVVADYELMIIASVLGTSTDSLVSGD